MADTQPSKPKQKRLVKNPETFRERAIKASQVSDKPSRSGRLKAATGKVTAPVFNPVGRVGGRFFRLKPIRLLGKVIFPVYLRNSWGELKLVNWPNLKQGRQLTFAVLIFAIIFGAIIALVDFGLDKVFRDILLK